MCARPHLAPSGETWTDAANGVYSAVLGAGQGRTQLEFRLLSEHEPTRRSTDLRGTSGRQGFGVKPNPQTKSHLPKQRGMQSSGMGIEASKLLA